MASQFKVLNLPDEEDDSGPVPSLNANPQPNQLPDVTNPEMASAQDDPQSNLIAAKQKMRSGKAPMAAPGVEPGATIPWYSPDSLAAGAASGPISGALSGVSLNGLLSGEGSAAASAAAPAAKAASSGLMSSIGKGAVNITEEMTPYDQWAMNVLASAKKQYLNKLSGSGSNQ
jgi:hypothetical protein